MSRGVHGTLLAAAFWSAACGLAEQRTPQPSETAVAVYNVLADDTRGNLRLALVWIDDDLRTTADVPVPPVAAEGGEQTVLLPLRSAAGFPIASYQPQETVRIPNTSLMLSGYRPRVVLYDDVDDNGAFTPDVLGHQGPDRVLGIDNGVTSVCALSDLEAALQMMTLEETDMFYAGTGGIFTPFVQVESGSPLIFLPAVFTPILITVSDAPVPREQLHCGRQNVRVYDSLTSPSLRASGIVDVSLDASTLCGSNLATCVTEDFSTMPAPDLHAVSSDGHVRILQCRRGTLAEALVIHSGVRVCDSCVCEADLHEDAYFAAPDALPTWWPCGDAIPYCDSSLPMYTIDLLCETP